MAPRAIALGVVEREGKILVEVLNGKHSKGTGVYYRPPGGGIEHGETSREAICREFQEELRAEVHNLRYLGCLENIFRVDDQVGHEIAQIYFADFVEPSLYEQERLLLIEDTEHRDAVWVPLQDFLNEEKVLYPNDLAGLICQAMGQAV